MQPKPENCNLPARTHSGDIFHVEERAGWTAAQNSIMKWWFKNGGTKEAGKVLVGGLRSIGPNYLVPAPL